MRVSDSNIYNRIATSTSAALSRLDEVSAPLVTGKKITRPSEDPIQAQRQMRVDREIRQSDRYRSNISRVQVYHQFAETSVNNVVDTLSDMSAMANDSMDAGARMAAAAEVKQMLEGLKAMSNARFNGRYIFAGRKQSAPAYDDQMKFQGDFLGRTVPIGDELSSPGDVTGPNVFGSGNDGPTAFEAAQGLIDALENNDGDGIAAALEDLTEAHTRATQALTSIGFVLKDLFNVDNMHVESNLTHQIHKAELEDVDITTAASQLAFAQNVYQVSLQTSARLNQILNSQTQL